MLSYDPIPYTLQRTLVLTPCWPSSLSLSLSFSLSLSLSLSLANHEGWWEHTLAHTVPKILLMEEILHQLIGSLSHYLQGLIHPRWCRISSINSIIRLLSTTLRRTNQRMGNRGRRSYHAAKPLNRNHAAKPRSHKTTWWHSLTGDYQCHKAAKPKKKTQNMVQFEYTKGTVDMLLTTSILQHQEGRQEAQVMLLLLQHQFTWDS